MNFVEKLYCLLSEGHDYIKWWENGEVFSIDKEPFTAEVILNGKFDNIETWDYFYRELIHIHGFRRAIQNSNDFSHTNFRKGKYDVLKSFKLPPPTLPFKGILSRSMISSMNRSGKITKKNVIISPKFPSPSINEKLKLLQTFKKQQSDILFR